MNNISTFPNTKPPWPLRNARVHEVCGPSAYGFAAALCGSHKGQIMWLKENWQQEQLLPSGLTPFCNPARIVFATGPTPLDVLWMAEECLRSKAVPVVIVQLSQPLSFTQGRRLQLAAETGNCLGLFIVPEGIKSNTTETRWQCTPHFDPNDSTLQCWQLIKNKSGTIGHWIVNWNAKTRHLIVVSKIGERPLIAGAAN